MLIVQSEIECRFEIKSFINTDDLSCWPAMCAVTKERPPLSVLVTLLYPLRSMCVPYVHALLPAM